MRRLLAALSSIFILINKKVKLTSLNRGTLPF